MKKRKTRASDVGEKVRSREMKGQRPNNIIRRDRDSR